MNQIRLTIAGCLWPGAQSNIFVCRRRERKFERKTLGPIEQSTKLSHTGCANNLAICVRVRVCVYMCVWTAAMELTFDGRLIPLPIRVSNTL